MELIYFVESKVVHGASFSLIFSEHHSSETVYICLFLLHLSLRILFLKWRIHSFGSSQH